MPSLYHRYIYHVCVCVLTKMAWYYTKQLEEHATFVSLYLVGRQYQPFFLSFSSQTYVEFITEMGGVWLERHLLAIFHHILELLASPKTTATHIDSVYARKCASFILNTCVSRLLGESAQLLATKHLCKLVTQVVTATLPSSTAPGTVSKLELVTSTLKLLLLHCGRKGEGRI